MADKKKQDFDFHAEASSSRTGLARDFWDFLKHNKKWWLLPILVVMLLIGVLVVMAGSGLAPFIYTLF